MIELSETFMERIDKMEEEKRIHKLCESLRLSPSHTEREYIRKAISHVIHKTTEEVEAILG